VARRVHILGASGAGPTTLAQALAARLGCPHYDVDDYFWLPSDPPFQHIRDREARRAMLSADLDKPGLKPDRDRPGRDGEPGRRRRAWQARPG